MGLGFDKIKLACLLNVIISNTDLISVDVQWKRMNKSRTWYIHIPRAITLGLGRLTRQLLHSFDNSIIFVYSYYIDAKLSQSVQIKNTIYI